MEQVTYHLTDVWVTQIDDGSLMLRGHGSHTPDSGLPQTRTLQIDLSSSIGAVANCKTSRTRTSTLVSSIEVLFPQFRLLIQGISRISGLELLVPDYAGVES